jgi:hypothetical protein
MNKIAELVSVCAVRLFLSRLDVQDSGLVCIIGPNEDSKASDALINSQVVDLVECCLALKSFM